MNNKNYGIKLRTEINGENLIVSAVDDKSNPIQLTNIQKIALIAQRLKFNELPRNYI